MKKTEREFYTVRGYALLNQDDNRLTPSMEDYLEMSYRLSKDKGFTRMSDLAGALNVQPPSANKMVNKLAELGYFIYEKYGVIQLTEKGSRIGRYLLKRHEVIENFLKVIGVKDNVLEQTEKIEHNITENTLERIGLFLKFVQEHPHYLEEFKKFETEEK
ncbi:MAG: transcriptional regulator MntR [Clostridia bacterium]|nr:transcriptional regulator MntR [Clostridia bacterium]